jgi:hypothetical protein
VAKSFQFPLEIEKKWELEYKEDNQNSRHKFEQWHTKYLVVGYEFIEVPAGKFNAIKIEAEGTWRVELEPRTQIVQAVDMSRAGTGATSQINNVRPITATGRTYKAYWYSPEVKRWINNARM